jgi:hypothetical protein
VLAASGQVEVTAPERIVDLECQRKLPDPRVGSLLCGRHVQGAAPCAARKVDRRVGRQRADLAIVQRPPSSDRGDEGSGSFASYEREPHHAPEAVPESTSNY